MINLELFQSNNDHSDPFQEGFISSVLKSEADIDTKKIKEEWKDAKASGRVGIVNDTLDKAASSASKTVDKLNKDFVVRNQSIVARARNSVLQFPIYITQTLRVNEAHIIGKLFERVYTTLVQTVLSNNKVISEDEANDLVFLRQFHTNIKEAADVLVNKYYEPIDDMDAMLCESIFYTQKLTENCTVIFSVVPTTNQDLILENARLINEPLTGLSFYMFEAQTAPKKTETTEETRSNEDIQSLNDTNFRDMAISELIKNASEERLITQSNQEIINEINDKYAENEPDKSDKAKHDEWVKNRKDAIDKAIERRDDINKNITKKMDEIKDKIRNGKYGTNYQYGKGRYVRIDISGSTIKSKTTLPVDKAIDAPTILKDGDIKKFNGMLPYTIEATFRMRTKNGNDTDVKYIIGIKSVLHLIRVQDLSDDLKELIDGNMKSLQKVRYKTGEISALDYFFNIKGLKADASKNINYNKRWLNTLKRLGEYEKMNGTLMKKPIEAITGGNVPIPNGTLVLSMSDLTILTNQTGIDLSVVGNAKRLMKSLFLIAVCIVDSSAGTMRVLFDKDGDWEVQSLASIDADLAKTDNSKLMSELNSMINRGK